MCSIWLFDTYNERRILFIEKMPYLSKKLNVKKTNSSSSQVSKKMLVYVTYVNKESRAVSFLVSRCV